MNATRRHSCAWRYLCVGAWPTLSPRTACGLCFSPVPFTTLPCAALGRAHPPPPHAGRTARRRPRALTLVCYILAPAHAPATSATLEPQYSVQLSIAVARTGTVPWLMPGLVLNVALLFLLRYATVARYHTRCRYRLPRSWPRLAPDRSRHAATLATTCSYRKRLAFSIVAAHPPRCRAPPPPPLRGTPALYLIAFHAS